MKINDLIIVKGKEYKILSLLGKGKGGYSYLAETINGSLCVLKKIHHEPCDYYTFGNKIESEYNDYNKLLKIEINMPKMIDIDMDEEIIIKEYIEGETIFDLINNGMMKESYLLQVKKMAEKAFLAGLNIDYYPTNFVVKNDILYYVDYECNNYIDEWSFDNWAIKYWTK